MGLSFGCSALHGKDKAISDVERDDGAFVPFIFPWFQYLLTIRKNLLTIRKNIAATVTRGRYGVGGTRIAATVTRDRYGVG